MKISTYVCLDCFQEFESPVLQNEDIDFADDNRFVCPHCEGEAYTRAHLCDHCGELINGFYVKTADGKEYCEDCFQVRELSEY